MLTASDEIKPGDGSRDDVAQPCRAGRCEKHGQNRPQPETPPQAASGAPSEKSHDRTESAHGMAHGWETPDIDSLSLANCVSRNSSHKVKPSSISSPTSVQRSASKLTA